MTSFPSVNVHVASVSAYIPSVEATNSVPSLVVGHGTDTSATLTQKQIQIEVQKQDAQERTIVWDAEKIGRLDSLDEDAEFEDDPDFPKGALHDSAISSDEWTPMGTRNEKGDLLPFFVLPRRQELNENNMNIDAGGATQELLFTGRAECVPDCVRRLVGSVDSSDIPLV
jgi:meiosis-specific protein